MPVHVRQQIAEIARSQLAPADDSAGLITVEELHALSEADGAGWLHLAYQSKTYKACQHVLDQTLRLVSSHRPLMRWGAGAPAVHVHCGVWPARIPRGAVDIAIETRLANEWQ